MSEYTTIIGQVDHDRQMASEKLLPIVYEELRKLAAQRIAHEQPGLTLQATALVHEAWLRLVKSNEDLAWDSHGHFFSAAAEAMRRILIDRARQKNVQKRKGKRQSTGILCRRFVVYYLAGRTNRIARSLSC